MKCAKCNAEMEPDDRFCGECGSRIEVTASTTKPGPPIDEAYERAWVAVDSTRLRAMLRRTSYAMSEEESRPSLNGLYLELRRHELNLVASDGHRLALARTKVESDAELAGIVPRKAVLEMEQVLQTAEEVALAIRKNQFFLRTPGFELVSKLVEGQFPRYEQLIAMAKPRRLTVSRKPLIAALQRIYMLPDSRTCRLTVTPAALRLSAQSRKLSGADEILPADFVGEELTIEFNARYLLEAVGPIDGEHLIVDLKDGLSPGVFRSADDDAYLCVIMPVRI